MSIGKSFKHTVAASYIGYITQAIINNFAPMLFLKFHADYGISLEKIGLLVMINFGTQLIVDVLSAKLADKTGYRILIVAAHIMAAAGLVLFAFLPEITPDPYMGLCAAVMVYAVGGGLTEVLISPIVEAIPGGEKTAAMSMLHSFYCWGSVLVVLVSTALFAVFGINSWRYIACMWAVVPAVNAVYFSQVPIAELVKSGEGMTVGELVKSKTFLMFALLMICSGASELAMSQWASAFAEQGLGVSKAVGDIAGPCFFAVMMGTARVVHAKISGRIDLSLYITICAAVCAASYFIAALSPAPVFSLLACGICGFSVGVMWPGVFSLASRSCPLGGTALFALLALAGDCGCSAGPALVGAVSGAAGDSLRCGLMFAAIFPLILLITLLSGGKEISRNDR